MMVEEPNRPHEILILDFSAVRQRSVNATIADESALPDRKLESLITFLAKEFDVNGGISMDRPTTFMIVILDRGILQVDVGIERFCCPYLHTTKVCPA